jgi:hypothetical protein
MLYQLDSSNSIRINPSFGYQSTNNKSITEYQTLSEEQVLTNQGYTDNRMQNEGYNFRNDLTWRKKFAKKGRTFSLSVQTSFNESEGNGSLASVNSIYKPDGNLLTRDTLNQRIETNANLKGYTARAVYTEPLWKRSLLEFSGSKSDTRNISSKTTHDYNKSNGKYDQLNNKLSNDFENTYNYINAGFRIRTQKKKYSYSVGAVWQKADLEGKIISGVKDSLISKTFRNLLPTARFQYNFSKYKSFTLNYTTSTTQPSMAQLQPVPDVSNPIYIREGNPFLKQEFSHVLQSNLHLVSPFKNKNLFLNMMGRFTENRISNYDSVNLSTGVRKSRPVNVNGVYNINGNISYSMPVRFLKASFEIRNITGFSQNKQLINDQLGNVITNTIKTFNIGPEISLDINATDKINIALTAGFNYNKTKYSLQSALNNKYLSQDYDVSFDWELPKGFYFSTDFNYTINSQRSAGFNTKVPILNASISKQMLKYNRGELKFSGRDLLDKNIGISRNTNNNYIEDSRVLTLRRFFLLSFTYSLSKTGLNNTGGSGMKTIIR